MPWTPPNEFEEYQLLRQLGAGGMGTVFLAHDTLLDRHVAIKFISSAVPSAAQRERFITEARAAARLQHPNVVTVYRVGSLADHPYLVSEFIPGQSLDRIPKPVPWEVALDYAIALARGLAAAHRHGVLHRDIKPANAVLAYTGEVKLLDFGLAKLLGGVPVEPSSLADAPTDPAESAEPSPDATVTAAPPPDKTLTAAGDAPSPSPSPTPRSLTRAGAVMGTPYYMSPEAWRGEPATHRSDVYSLGALVYNLCAGKAPHRDAPRDTLRDAVLGEPAPPLRSVAADVPPELAAVVDRCLAREPDDRFETADALRDALEALRPGAARLAVPEGNPYRGLHRFEAEHRALFFGRAAEVRDVVERLRSDAFVLVAGDSGVGKSSLCRAGVLPLVEDGELGADRTWRTAYMVPGVRPIAALAAAAELPDDAREPADIVRALRRAAGDGGLLILVDQLEELLTLADDADAGVVAEVMARIATGIPGVRVVATARCDFLTPLAAMPGLGRFVSRALYLLGPLSREGLREAIVGPARAKGVSFETEALIDELGASATTASGLPLLQFALAELWDARDRDASTITEAALRDIGGVVGALARHADAAIAHMLPAERAAARAVLTRLVTAHDTRARRSRAELCDGNPDAEAALEALVRARLVATSTTDADADDATYEVAHEALLSSWTTLRDWLEARRDQRAIHARLDAAAREWDRLDRGKTALWSAEQVDEARALPEGDLVALERSFLTASTRAVRTRRLVRWTLALGIPMLAGLAYGAAELKSRADRRAAVDARVAEADAVMQTALDSATALADARAQAYAAFDRGDDAAEAMWTNVLANRGKVDDALRRAAQVYEAAFIADSSRPDARTKLARALYERALLAEADRRSDVLRGLLDRLALYDTKQQFVRKWRALGGIELTTEPAADATLATYVRSPTGRWEASSPRPLGQTPVSLPDLPPGSYVLELTAADRVTVRYPVEIRRGRTERVELWLPPITAVPEGFVYVAPGTFYFGYAGEESQRVGFYFTAPIHRTKSDAFSISRHETTIGEYVHYLESLPPAERAAATPRRTPDVDGAQLGLRQLSDGRWELELQPNTVLYTARSDEPFQYEERDRRTTQDWLRFPIGSVSAQRAEAYAAWLSATGRVPGARLCTEREWVRAARGADMRTYPHADRIAPTDANYDETYGKQPRAFGPDEVGSHPGSASPFGVQDLAGNVWEWTLTSWGDQRWAAVGGSYYQTATTAEIPNRLTPEPTFVHSTIGIRVCADAPRQPR